MIAGIVALILATMPREPTAQIGLVDDSMPLSPGTVVLQLDGPADAGTSISSLRQALRRTPEDAALASRYVAAALQHYARTGDARYLGFADGALAPWRERTRPPPDIWLLRGRILQTQHRFAEAATDLDRLVAAHGDSAEALLLAADGWRRAGEIDRARARCARLALGGWQDLAAYCAADVFLSLGEPDKAQHALASVRIAEAGTSAADPWALAVAADVAAASGRADEALRSYRSAVALPAANLAVHLAYADHLLDLGHARQAMEAMESLPPADAVLLRRTIAAERMGSSMFNELRSALYERFRLASALGPDDLHLRERAIAALYVDADPEAALELARQNWALQKGWEDASIFLRAATASGRPDAAAAVTDWRAHFRRESH